MHVARQVVVTARLLGQWTWFWMVHRRCAGLKLVRAYRPVDDAPVLTGMWCPVHRMGIAV